MDRTTPTDAIEAHPPAPDLDAPTPPNDFERAAAELPSTGIVAEFWGFLRENGAWWLAPIIAVLLLIGLVALLSSTAAAPFIYTLF